MVDKKTKKFRGFGFVNFCNSESCNKAVEVPKQKMYNTFVEVKKAESKSQTSIKQKNSKFKKLFLFDFSHPIKEGIFRPY